MVAKLSLPQLAAALPAAGAWNNKETCFWGWNQTAQLPFLLLSCGWIPTSLLSTARSPHGLSLWHSFSSFDNINLVCQISPFRDFPLHWRMLFCVLMCCIKTAIHFTAGSFNMHFLSPAIKLYLKTTRNGWSTLFWRYILALSCMSPTYNRRPICSVTDTTDPHICSSLLL